MSKFEILTMRSSLSRQTAGKSTKPKLSVKFQIPLEVDNESTHVTKETKEPKEGEPMMFSGLPKGCMVLINLNRQSFGYPIVRSFLKDCLRHPKIFYHDVLQTFREIIEKSRGSPFTGSKHRDFTYSTKKPKITDEETLQDVEEIVVDLYSSWCTKELLHDSETRDVTPVIWSPNPCYFFFIEAFLDYILREEMQKKLVNEGLQEYFEDDLRADYEKLIGVLVDEKASDQDYEALLQDCKPTLNLGDGISASCCRQDFDSAVSLFAHLSTTHELVGKQRLICFEKIQNHFLETAVSTKIVIKFGWNNDEREYGMLIDSEL